MYLEERYLSEVKRILKEYVPDYKVKAFGSRVHGKNLRKFSDLDIVIMTQTKLDRQLDAALRDAFVKSSLPFRVDVLDWKTLDRNLQEIINESSEDIQ